MLEPRAQLVGGADGAQRVVLVHERHAEDGHHRVADELLDGAAVPLQHDARLVEVAQHHAPGRLRVDRLAEGRRADDVAEEDRDGLPHELVAPDDHVRV